MYLRHCRGWCHMKLLPSRRVLCTPHHHAPCHFMQSHTSKVHACLAVTCHLHFWQNDRDLLRATAVTLSLLTCHGVCSSCGNTVTAVTLSLLTCHGVCSSCGNTVTVDLSRGLFVLSRLCALDRTTKSNGNANYPVPSMCLFYFITK